MHNGVEEKIKIDHRAKRGIWYAGEAPLKGDYKYEKTNISSNGNINDV